MNKLALAGACLVLSAVSAHAQYVDGLPAAASVSSGDLVPVVQGSTPITGGGFLPGSGVARRATVGQIANAVGNTYVPYSGASSPVNLGAFPLTLGVASAPSAPGTGGALYVDSSNVLHYLTSAGDIPALGNGAHTRLNVMGFGAKMDGTTNDTTAFNNARGAAANNATIVVPPGGVEIFSTPTAGPATVLWELSGNGYGTGTTPVNGMGTDTVETVLGGGKFLARSNSVANGAPILRLDSTLNHTGGTTGNVMSTLQVNTYISPEASALNNYPWGITSTITSSATGPAQVTSVVGYANRLANGSEIWGGNFGAFDKTGNKSSVAGAQVGIEVDMTANDIDDGGAATTYIPAGSGIRALLDIDPNVQNTSGPNAVFGWGVRVGGPSNVSVNRDFAGYGIVNDAVFSSEFAVLPAGANALRMATGQSIAFTANGAHTLAYSGGLNYAVSGATVFDVGDNGHLGIGATWSNGIGVIVGGTTSVGLDTSTATLSGPAVRIAQGQSISMTAVNDRTLTFSSGHLNYAVSGTTVFSITDSGAVILAQTTVAALPTCNAALKGGLMGVTDATSPTYNGALTGGGTVAIPVYCNGSVWTAH